MTQGSDEVLIDGRYRLIRRVGQGGMGTVWQARNELLDRMVAIKQLNAPPGDAQDERAGQVERVRREARMAARLDHPGIVRVHDVIDWEGLPAIVMEYVDGRSLAAHLRERGPLSVEETARLGLALLDALRHAHAAGVVHRDLKPDNILLAGARTVITDFGIARPLERATTLTLPGTLIGTPVFMAPEQIEGKAATTASDLWSLGVTLYAAVEGVLPFEGETITEVCVAVLTRPARSPRIAGPLSPLLMALLTKDPAGRATAASATLHLAAIDRRAPVPAQPPAVTVTEAPTPPGLAAPDPRRARTVAADLTARRPGREAGQGALSSEWENFWSLRSTYVTLLIAVVGMIVLALVVCSAHSRDTSGGLFAPAAGGSIAWSLTGGTLFAQFAVGVLGVLLVTGEDRKVRVQAAPAALTRPVPVLWARVCVFAAVMWPLGTAATAVSFGVGQAMLTAHNLGTPWAAPGVARAVFGIGVFLALIGPFGVVLGALTRSTLRGVASLFGVLFVLPLFVALLPGTWGGYLRMYVLPSGAESGLITAGGFDERPWISVGMLALYIIVGLFAATRLRRRGMGPELA